MKILYTSPVIEYPAAGGPQLRIENSIKALSQISELYVVSRNAEYAIGGREAVSFYKSLTQEFLFAPSVYGLHSNRYIRKLQRIIRKLQRIIGSFKNQTLQQDADFLLEIVKNKNIEIIWFGYGNISYDLIKLVKSTNPNIKVICDTDSVWSRFLLRELPYETDPERIEQIKSDGLAKEKEEAEWVNFCDVTTAVSEVDALYYSDLAIDKSKIMLFSNVIDMNNYSNLVEKPDNLKNPNIYLAGTFGPKSAMDKAARWFIEDIYPIVKKQIPEIHFYIIGNASKETLVDIKDPSITILGKVKSVLPYLTNADVSIVPLQFESGTRFKIMEAAACKIPIVSTTLGAEGIPVKDRRDILLADDADQFANAIVELIKNKDLSQTIALNCFDLIHKNNSVDSLVVEAKEILKRLSEC